MSRTNHGVRHAAWGYEPSQVKVVRIKRDLLSEVALAYAAGEATLQDLEDASDSLARAKLEKKNDGC